MPKKALKKRFRQPKRRLANETKKSSASSIEFSIPEPSTSESNPGEGQSSAINLRNTFILTELSKPTQNSSSRRKQSLTPKINEGNSGCNEIDGSPCLTSAGETCPVEEVDNSLSSTAVEEDGHILTSLSDAIPLELTFEEEELNDNTTKVVPRSSPVVSCPTQPILVPVSASPMVCDPTVFWQQVRTLIDSSISIHWQIKVEDNRFHLMQLSSGIKKVVQKSIVVEINANVTDINVFVHGHSIPVQHDFWKVTLKSLPIESPSTPEKICALILDMYTEIRNWQICVGVINEDLWRIGYPNCFVEEGFENYRFRKTLRSSACLYLVKKRICAKCHILRACLGQIKRRREKRKDGTPNKFIPDCKLSTPECKARTKSLRRDKRNLKRRLADNALARVERDGVDIDSDLNSSLSDSLNSCKLSEFQEILLNSQKKYSSLKKKNAIKWHPAMIRFALNLKLVSSKAYNVVTRYIDLPNERTLYDYSHAMSIKEGIVDEFVKRVADTITTSDCSKKYMLSFDEIYISQNLVHCKETGAMIGYCKLSEAEEEIRQLEMALSDNSKPIDCTPPISKTMLCFMVRSVFSPLKEVVASFGVNSLSKEFLFKRHWEVVEYLEISGLEIVGCVCDGAAVNRSFIAMHKPMTATTSKVIFDTCNIYSWPRRPYCFFSDVPHLLKTLRNNLECKARNLTKNGQQMSWKTILRLYESSKTNTLRKSFKLDAQCVYLNSYSKMKVSYAARIFSKTVANEIKGRNWDNTSELVIFIEKVNDFFDILNGCFPSEYICKRNENLAPYTSANDKRLALLDEFVEYLLSWQKEVENLPGVPGKKKEMMFISPQTLTGVEMTVYSFKSVIRSLLPAADSEGENEPRRYIMARVFNQDKLEQYFGKQRARNGGSTNPNESQFFRNMNALFMVRQLSTQGKHGNTQETEESSESLLCDTTPVIKRKAARSLLYPAPI